jgi:hypothetical protein
MRKEEEDAPRRFLHIRRLAQEEQTKTSKAFSVQLHHEPSSMAVVFCRSFSCPSFDGRSGEEGGAIIGCVRAQLQTRWTGKAGGAEKRTVSEEVFLPRVLRNKRLVLLRFRLIVIQALSTLLLPLLFVVLRLVDLQWMRISESKEG